MSLKNFKSLPKSIYFILGNTVLERITSGGIFGKHLILFSCIQQVKQKYLKISLSAILALYLNQQLLFNESISTAIFHGNDLVLHAATIFGAILADSYVGLYKSLFTMIIVFGVGCAILSIAAMDFSLTIMR